MKGNQDMDKKKNSNPKNKTSNKKTNANGNKSSNNNAGKNKKGEAKNSKEVKQVKTDHRDFEEVKKSKIKTPTSEPNEIVNLIKIVAIVCAVVLAALGLAYVINAVRDKEEETPEEVEIQYEEILLGTLLNQQPKEYYVMILAEKDNASNMYMYYLDKNNYAEKPVKLYRATLESGFNQSYVAEESNLKVSNVTDFKVKESTLVKVKDKKVVEAYEGRDKIVEVFKKIIK